MTRLMAIRPVLYRSHQYEAGDTLPADNEATVAAWIECGSAVWNDDEAQTEAKAPKAKLATAKPGISGKSSDGDPNALVGQVPDTPERKRPSKGKKS